MEEQKIHRPAPGGGGKRRKQTLKEFSDVVYLTFSDITFYKTEGGLLGGRTQGYDGRINLLRIFPLSKKDEFISVRNSEYEELGIMERLDGFSEEQLSLIYEELERRYFTPKITKVIDIKEDFGNYFWQCETTAGERSFTVRDLANNLLFMAGGILVLIDTDGNRYAIEDVKSLGAKAVKYLDIWL